MTKAIITRLGKSRKGRPLELNMLMQKSDAEAHLAKYDVDEQVDMLCVLEYILYTRFVADADRALDEDCMEIMFEFLDKKRQDVTFADYLDKLGLRTSVDRLRHGQARAL